MGTYYDDEGLHWRPLRFFPWVEMARGLKEVRPNILQDGRWFRWSPPVLEQTTDLRGRIMQTVRLADGREQVRDAYWLL